MEQKMMERIIKYIKENKSKFEIYEEVSGEKEIYFKLRSLGPLEYGASTLCLQGKDHPIFDIMKEMGIQVDKMSLDEIFEQCQPNAGKSSCRVMDDHTLYFEWFFDKKLPCRGEIYPFA
jgi:hypothetical protein